MNTLFRALPSVDACLTLLNSQTSSAPVLQAPRPLVRELVNSFLEARRNDIRAGRITNRESLSLEALTPQLLTYVATGVRPQLRRVLNATGVVIHTNMGRSVLAKEAVEAAALAAGNYSNLELDLATGERGSRQALVAELICRLTGAEAALVVNNNAAAVLVMLNSLCQGGEVVVSRGQLVEIGGSFRIPDVMTHSGALLREVGTTNRTHMPDYAQAINAQTKALLRVHTSNYRIIGFHADVSVEELSALAHEHSLPMLEDLGSGSFLDYQPWGLPAEPTPAEVLQAGADVITFSGDKVLGGPQAGIIAGKKTYIDRIAKNQLMRALRCDKMTLAALEATLRLYLDPALRTHIPTVRCLTYSQADLESMAAQLLQQLEQSLQELAPMGLRLELRPGFSRVGGGSFPERDLPTTLVALFTPSAEHVRKALLRGEIPLMGRVEHDAFLLDPRTLSVEEFPEVVKTIYQALRQAFLDEPKPRAQPLTSELE